MGDYPVASRKNDYLSTPKGFAVAGGPGQIAVLSVSATPLALSLLQGISQAPFNRTTASDPAQFTRNCITIECDVDLGIIFGSTLASVTTTNAPVIATVGSLVANVYTGLAATCYVLYAKQPFRVQLTAGVDLFMGFVGSGAGTMRLYQSSSDVA